ncbi:MAG TPA: hypothetical protein VLA13_09310 [Massilibacterium sp.]|nr:hypothetical protein [Massilibacterium sp.]
MANNKKRNEEEEVFYVENSGIKVGHRKIPRFLVIAFTVVSIWAVIYAVKYPGYVKEERTVEKTPQEIVTTTCLACHGATAPAFEEIAGIEGMNAEYIIEVLDQGGAAITDELSTYQGADAPKRAGMPSYAANEEVTENAEGIAEYILTLK